MTNPLFPTFDKFQRELQDAAMREWRQSDLGKLVKGLNSGGIRSTQQIAAAKRLLRSARSGGVARYGKVSDWIKQEFFQQLSRTPLGSLVGALVRPSGQSLVDDFNRELEAAVKLLEAFGYEVKSPTTGQRPMSPNRPGGSGAKAPTRPVIVQADEPLPSAPAGPPIDTGSRQVGGRRYNFSPNDPILTGEMIPVSSSNVRSIGFIWNHEDPMKGTLKVKFLGVTKDGKRAGPGSMYYYHGVHPDVFQAFRQASSKGKFVWDRLRVRGTVSGHQYRYDLAGISPDGYVPRKATRIGPNEYYLGREVRGQDGRTYTSALDDEFVQRVGTHRRPPPHSAGRGMPNRGLPNRGEPNRGR